MADLRASLEAALAERYTIERELGRGGMATVYLARDLRHDRPVALKVLHPDLAATLGPERFLREIKLAARLQHPHILTVLDSGAAGQQGSGAELLWFTMPFVEGESLRDRLSREKQLAVTDAVRIAREAAAALDYAHRHDTIHRDVKPENLLLTSDGQVLVADFGIGRALTGAEQGREESRLTETGMVVGTPAYMSPEQASGQREVDGRTDIYSLGVVLYEMLAGETPFTGPTAQAIIAKRFSGEVPSIRKSRPTVPEEVERAVSQALAMVPADRFATAGDMARSLEAAPPGRAATETRATAARPPAASRPALARPLTAALGLGFLLGLGVLFGWLRTHDRPAAGGPEAPRLLAVLPFENLGDSADAYFADGITDEVRGKLATLPGLQVIASGSAVQYKNSSKTPQQIAEELGVNYLLTGKIRWEKSPSGQRVRVSPELVQVTPGAAPTTRWQQPFDASLTDVFQVQADIADRVAQALDLALASGTQRQLAERPTANLAAYDAYLKGVESYGLDRGTATLRKAVRHFEEAVALDTSFAPAWARLSQAASLLAVQGVPSPALAAQSRAAAERALALAPDRPEGHVAMGDYLRRIGRDTKRALEEYARGLQLSPSNAELLRGSSITEGNMGRWDSALAHLQRARALDPRSATIAADLTNFTIFLRRYPEAREAADRSLALSPGNLQSFEWKVASYLGEGDLAGARSLLRSAPSTLEPTALVAYVATYYDLFWALDEEQQRLVLRLGPAHFDNDRGAWGLALAGTHALRGDQVRARAYADSARIAMEEQIRDAPDDRMLPVYQGTALAYLGRKAEALAHGKLSLQRVPISSDATTGPYAQHQFVRICILVGEYEQALDYLEPLLKIPYYLSPAWLRIDPTFDPLRKHPRFQRLVEGTS